jgi:hypothetical protein
MGLSARIGLASFVLAAAAFSALDPASRPITGDNQVYFFMAERAASGTPPHLSHVDTKQQLGTLVTAAAIATGRAAGFDDVLAARTVSIAAAATAVALAALLAWSFAAALLPSAGAPLLAAAFAALGVITARGFAEHAATGANVKIFLAALATAAHFARTRQSRAGDIAAGLFGGAAFCTWQPALLVPGALVLEALFTKRRSAGGAAPQVGSRDLPVRDRPLRSAVTIVVAALAAFVGYELWFLLEGALGEQLRQSFVLPLGSVHPPTDLAGSLRFLLAEGRGPAWPPRLLPLAAAAAVAMALARPAFAASAFARVPGFASFAMAGAGATAFTLYDHQGVPDLFFPYPYFAVATGLVAAGLLTRIADRRSRRASALGAAIVAAALVVPFLRDGGRREPAYRLADQRRLAQELKAWTGDATVYVYGAVHLLGLAHLDNHVPYALYFDDVAREISFDDYRPLRSGRMPDLIVQSRGDAPGARSWRPREYWDSTPAAFAAQGISVWRRAPAATPGSRAGISGTSSRPSVAAP